MQQIINIILGWKSGEFLWAICELKEKHRRENLVLIINHTNMRFVSEFEEHN